MNIAHFFSFLYHSLNFLGEIAAYITNFSLTVINAQFVKHYTVITVLPVMIQWFFGATAVQ